MSNRCFTSQDIPMEEVTSSPPNGTEGIGSDFCPTSPLFLRRGGQSPFHLRRSPLTSKSTNVAYQAGWALITTPINC